MKKVLSLALILLSAGIYAQDSKKIDIPEAVQKAFKEKFPKVKNVQWEMEGEEEYEAEFKKEDKEVSALFAVDGTWIETETDIKPNEVPQVILDAIAEEYDDFTILEAEKIERADGMFYELEINSDGRDWEMEVSPEGEIIEIERLEVKDEAEEE